MATTTGQAEHAGTDYSRTERVGFAIYMIVGPLIVLAATIIHPPHGIRVTSGSEYYGAAHDHTTRFYIAHTLFFLGGVFLLPAVIGLTRLVRRTHPKAAFWGLVLSAMGFVSWGAFDGMDFMTYVAGSEKNLNTTMMQGYIDDALANTAVTIPTGIIFLLLVTGLVVTCVGLHRAGILHLGLALLLPIGVLGVLSFLNYPPLLIASGLCLCASVGTVGVRQLRTPDAAIPGQPAPAS
ncbi:hypothetical protein [Catellatospora paridis]|uniref:hypothetical protein n=1 Tax=Catellatospora paridis TaxID=1617086 RepID=UPI0012D482AB|nr:hypothetical protein [Catellatospora paridis]